MPNAEFLSKIHELQSAADDAKRVLDMKINADPHAKTIEIEFVGATALSTLITVQSTLIRQLVEENEQILDAVKDRARAMGIEVPE